MSVLSVKMENYKKKYKRGTTVPYCEEPEYLLNEISYILFKNVFFFNNCGREFA